MNSRKYETRGYKSYIRSAILLQYNTYQSYQFILKMIHITEWINRTTHIKNTFINKMLFK